MSVVKDTFIAFLRDNIDASIPIHFLHFDKNDQEAMKIHCNSINIEFLETALTSPVNYLRVVVDVVADDEATVDLWISKVNAALTSCMTPCMDYTDPDNPSPVGGNIFWDFKVVFRPVRLAEPMYVHYSATFTLNHQQ